MFTVTNTTSIGVFIGVDTHKGVVQAFGIEGTGSHGAGLSRFLRERGHAVVEANRPNRQLRHQKGKSDAVDAESAARAVPAGQASGQPKSGTGPVEMTRHLKVARNTAVKARTQAMQTLKATIACSPDALREQFDQVSGKMGATRRATGSCSYGPTSAARRGRC